MPLNFGDMGKESIFAVLTLIQRQTEACQERAIFLIAQPQIIAALYPRVVPLMRPQPAFDDSVSDGKGKAVFLLPVIPKSLIMATNNSHARTGRTIPEQPAYPTGYGHGVVRDKEDHNQQARRNHTRHYHKQDNG